MQLSQVEKDAASSLTLLPLLRWMFAGFAVITAVTVFDKPELADSSFELASLLFLAIATVGVWVRRIPLSALWVLLAGANIASAASSIEAGEIGGSVLACACFCYMVWAAYRDRGCPSERDAHALLDDDGA